MLGTVAFFFFNSKSKSKFIFYMYVGYFISKIKVPLLFLTVYTDTIFKTCGG